MEYFTKSRFTKSSTGCTTSTCLRDIVEQVLNLLCTILAFAFILTPFSIETMGTFFAASEMKYSWKIKISCNVSWICRKRNGVKKN